MAASSSRCPYCYKLTNSVSRHIQQVAACKERWLAEVNNPIASDPSAMQDIAVGRIDNDEGWPLGGLGDDDDLGLGYDDAGRHRVISKTAPGSMVQTHLMTAILDDDMETDSDRNHILEYPGPAGLPVPTANPAFAWTHQANDRNDQAPWAPFADKDEWEFGQWMLKTLGHHEMDELLALNFVSSYPRFSAAYRLGHATIDKTTYQRILSQQLYLPKEGRQPPNWTGVDLRDGRAP